MNAPIRLGASLVLLALGLSSAQAAAQTFRMASDTGSGWQTSASQVTCVNFGGFTRWSSHTTNWRLNTSGQGSGKNTAIGNALASWTNVSNADFVLNLAGTTSATFKAADGVNSLSWGTDGVCDAYSCHAITALYMNGSQIIQEADILFNANPTLGFQWMTNGQYSPNCAQTAGSFGLMLDTEGIAAHELGHGLGIHHPSNATTSTATMGNVACTTAGRTLENDDILALRCSEDRYPESPTYQGSFDTATCANLTGWAWNANLGYERSYVEIVEDLGGGNVQIRGIAHADQSGAPVGDGIHAFQLATPAVLKNATWRTLRARYSGNQANVGATHQIICGKQLFPSNLNPSDPPLSTGGQPYEVGTQFKSDVPGKITELGYYFALGESAAPSHTIKLWSDTGTLLASSSITPPVIPGGAGWRYVSISPVSIAANTNYRVSVDTYLYQSKSSCGSPGSLQTPYVSSPLTALQGLWRTGVGSMPNIGSCSNFFVSVRFDS